MISLTHWRSYTIWNLVNESFWSHKSLLCSSHVNNNLCTFWLWWYWMTCVTQFCRVCIWGGFVHFVLSYVIQPKTMILGGAGSLLNISMQSAIDAYRSCKSKLCRIFLHGYLAVKVSYVKVSLLIYEHLKRLFTKRQFSYNLMRAVICMDLI